MLPLWAVAQGAGHDAHLGPGDVAQAARPACADANEEPGDMERFGLEAAADSLGTETDARRTAIPQLSNRRLNVSASVQSRAPVNMLWLRNSGSSACHGCDAYAPESSMAPSIE